MTDVATGQPVRYPPGLPGWWQPLLARVSGAQRSDFSGLPTPADGGRPGAVLILLGSSAGDAAGLPSSSGGGAVGSAQEAVGSAREADGGVGSAREAVGSAREADGGVGSAGPDVLLLQRAADMRNHAGQPAFPGGAADPGDAGPVATALREATEEVGLDPATVEVLATLPPLWIPVSRFVVTPVLAWWRAPHPVQPGHPAEVARVERVPVAELVDPANRVLVRHPSGWIGPAFRVKSMLVWGFTAGVLAALLDMGGWERPWRDAAGIVELPVAGDRPVP